MAINDEKAGSGRLEHTVPARFGLDAMDISMDLGAPVNEDHMSPFAFTGELKQVTIDLK